MHNLCGRELSAQLTVVMLSAHRMYVQKLQEHQKVRGGLVSDIVWVLSGDKCMEESRYIF